MSMVFDVRFVTPLLIGGENPKGLDRLGLRGTSLRGCWRFWCRAMLGGMLSDIGNFSKSVGRQEKVRDKIETVCQCHKERNPSFSFYRSTKTLTCFGGCGWNDGKDSGDIIDFVAKYEGIGKLDAAKKICVSQLLTARITCAILRSWREGIGTSSLELHGIQESSSLITT